MTAIGSIQIGKGWFPEEPGGLERYYYELMRHLPHSGVSVRGLVTGSPRVARESRGIVSAFAPTRATLLRRCRGVRHELRRALRAEPESVVAGHFALYAAPCLDLIRARPFVAHFQGPWADESRAEGAGDLMVRAKRSTEHLVYRRARRVITMSRAFAQLLSRQEGIALDHIDVIPGGIDTDRWTVPLSRRAARTVLAWPDDRPIVFVVRRLVRRMGLDLLVESIRALRRTTPDVLLIIAGEGPMRPALEEQVSRAGLKATVRFLGRVDDEWLPYAYRAADLSVVPSMALEGFGLVAAESLAAGTPVLVSAVGGLPEVVEGLAPQCVVPEQTPAAWSDTIAAALRGTLALPSAETCIRHVRAHFDWGVVAARIGTVYREAAQ